MTNLEVNFKEIVEKANDVELTNIANNNNKQLKALSQLKAVGIPLDANNEVRRLEEVLLNRNTLIAVEIAKR